MKSSFSSKLHDLGSWLLARAAVVGRTLLSNRGLAVIVLLGCAVVAISPWLRPAISRDLRGVHIPWSSPGVPFAPPHAAEVPRQWLLSSVAVPILVVIAIGIFLVVTRRHRIATSFGMLLAISLPAAAAVFWNHPGLVEFCESEVRQRAVLREVFRHQSEELLTGGAPDRLVSGGFRNTPEGYRSKLHSILLPFRYAMYGPWLVVIAAVGVVVARSGSLRHRLAYGARWAIAGLLLAAAMTWPRWVAEYHWMQANRYEDANRLAEAEASLDNVRSSMPALTATRRYWLARGRVGYRQKHQDAYTSYYVAHQHAIDGRYSEAYAVLRPYAGDSDSSVVARELLAEVISRTAANHIVAGDYSAAEVEWTEAALIAPWMPGHWIAQYTTALAANPVRAEEIENELLPRLVTVGDRMVNSDVASVIGDAYFNVGDFVKAREMYDRSIANFHLPKYANLHAQEGRLGL